MQNYFATLLFPSECLSELRLLEGAVSCFLSLRDVAGSRDAWLGSPASWNPGRVPRQGWVGGLGSLGHRANVKSNRNGGGGWLWEQGGAQGVWTQWAGGVKGAYFRDLTGHSQLAAQGAVQTRPKGWKSWALS